MASTPTSIAASFPFEDGFYCIERAQSAAMQILYPVILYPAIGDGLPMKCVVEEFTEVTGDYKIVSRCHTDGQTETGILRELWKPTGDNRINVGGVVDGVKYVKCNSGFESESWTEN
jgi:hypothetical protein